jgi:hypothetical protein
VAVIIGVGVAALEGPVVGAPAALIAGVAIMAVQRLAQATD